MVQESTQALSYRDAGVDIDKGNLFVSRIKSIVSDTHRRGVLTDIGGFAGLTMLTRNSFLDELSKQYVETARAKGLSPLRVVFVHALRNALIPVLTVIGLQVGVLLAGAVLTETIFSWPGIGKWLIDAIGRRDYPVVQNGILIVATLVIIVNFTVDILYGVANPRIRHQPEHPFRKVKGDAQCSLDAT